MAQRLMHRFWCGALPHFQLLSSESERDAEAAISETFFGSLEFATLRTQLTLALQETPSITSTTSTTTAWRRPTTAQLTALIELCGRYKQYVLALVRYTNQPATTATSTTTTTATTSTAISDAGVTYRPLFSGFADVDLTTDRFVGKDRLVNVAVSVDAVLVFVVLGQLYALQAESLVDQGLYLQSAAIIAAADANWRWSTLHFTRAAGLAQATMAQWPTSGLQVAHVAKFYSCVATQAVVMARLAQMHRASARITSMLLVDETIERLARNAAVCARYAYTVAMQTREVAAVLDDSPLSRQLAWLVDSYAVRWQTIVYSYEQTVFQLDFCPEIAMYFADLIQRGERLAPLPEYSHRSDSYFTRLAQELQHAHAAHLNESMDEKTTLVALCQRKFSLLWTFQPLPRELVEEFARIEPLEELFREEIGECDADTDLLAVSGDDDDDGDALTIESIRSNVQRARDRGALETRSLAAFSTEAVENEQCHHRRDRQSELNEHTVSSKASNRLERPFSAGPRSSPSQAPASTKSSSSNNNNNNNNSSSSSDWVSMRVAGGKTLHFEPLQTPGRLQSTTRPPRPSTAGTLSTKTHRRNAVPMVVDDGDDDGGDSTGLDPSLRVKNLRARLQSLRPSSSPSYLTSSTTQPTTKKKKLPDAGGGLTWVPTRVPCALCERRFMRQNLPGVVVMKRVFDLRRKWGMVLQDSKKFSAASALYGKASVCLMCQDILSFEDDLECTLGGASTTSPSLAPLDDVAVLIRNRILSDWQQQPPVSDELLLDVAVNKRARQSSTNFGLHAPNAVQRQSLRTAHTREEQQPWWEVDLANYYVIHSVKVWLREDTSHVYSFGGSGRDKHTRSGGHGVRQIAATTEMALSAVGFLHSGAGVGMACGALAPAPQPNVGLYPLHLSVSMKTGVDRDVDDILASAVSSHSLLEKAVQPITWLTPPNCRGRFVRIQAEGVAFLHIERVNVFVAQDVPTNTATVKRETVRKQLKRAAFRASVIGIKSSAAAPPGSPVFDTKDATLAALACESRAKNKANCTTPGAPKHDPKHFLSAFSDPEQVEKRRISRLYQKFKGLLDARAKYTPVAGEDGEDEEEEEEESTRFKG